MLSNTKTTQLWLLNAAGTWVSIFSELINFLINYVKIAECGSRGFGIPFSCVILIFFADLLVVFALKTFAVRAIRFIVALPDKSLVACRFMFV